MFHALVHYHEVALKGRNRGYFEQRLVHHLRSALKDVSGLLVDALPGRIRVSFPDEQSQDRIRETLTRTFGVTNFLFARSTPILRTSPDLTALKAAIQQDLPSNGFRSFRILTKRAEKRFPKTSMDIDREIGAYICEQTGKQVNLMQPDLTIHIELLKQEAYYGFLKEHGPGGLPVGTGGNVLCLISGGIDSPVAAYRMIKRGCRVVFIHFHGRPYLSRASEEKVRDLVTLLTRHQLSSKLYLVPFGDIQKQIVLGAPAPIRVVLYRRMMLRISEALAQQEDAWGLVTGDSLGQVASQTPGNIQVVSEVTSLPILRPLIGMDKSEITDQAHTIGSFEISIEPDQDCCTLFVPRHPDTRARLAEVIQVEQHLDIPGMVKQGLAQIDLAEFTFPK